MPARLHMPSAAAPATDKRQPPCRRWFQLSLRTLFVLMLLISVALAWLATVKERGRQQRQAAQAIQNLGGHVFYYEPSTVFQKCKWLNDWLGTDALVSPKGVNAANTTINDESSANLKGMTKLRNIWLPRTHIHDAGLANLAGMQELTQLQLSSTSVSSAGLVHLKGLTKLDCLHLDSTQVSDSGLVHLSGLTNLNYLELNKTQVSDAGLVHLSGLTKLRHLDLSDTQMSDAGLVHLKGLTKLEELLVKNTQVTEAGISELKKALPALKVE